MVVHDAQLASGSRGTKSCGILNFCWPLFSSLVGIISWLEVEKCLSTVTVSVLQVEASTPVEMPATNVYSYNPNKIILSEMCHFETKYSKNILLRLLFLL